MKTMRMLGVMVVAGIGIGAALSYLLPDLNFGLGSSGIGLPTGNTDTKPETQVVGIDAASEEKSTAEADAATAAPPAVVYVLLDGREYLLRRGPEGKVPFKPVTLDEVVEAAQSATGDENGIRVRIEQKRSSRHTTQSALEGKLEAAGVPKDSIRWKDEPAD